MDFLLQKIEIFFLVLVRLLTFLSIMPVFSARPLPMKVRVAAALVMALTVAPVVSAPPVATNNAIGYALLAGKEILVGIVMGFGAQFIFYGVRVAGHLLGYQFGFAIASTFDPMNAMETSLISQFKWLVATMLFLAMNAHHLFLEAMVKSFYIVPLTKATFPDSLALLVMRLSAETFLIGVKLAAPVMIVILLTNVGLGLMARTMPHLNVFMISFPVTIGLGLISLMIIMPLFATAVERLVMLAKQSLIAILQMLGG